MIKVSDIESESVKVDQAFLDSVRSKGVVTPVMLRKKDGKLRVMDGRVRIAACRELGIEEIPADVREYTDEQEAEILLMQ